jgi:hypothetical protein
LSLFQDQRNIEKSVADVTDKLSWVEPDKVIQFGDMTYTEVTNFAYVLNEADQLKKGFFPFTEKRLMPSTAKGMPAMIEREVPLTYSFGEGLENISKLYMQGKISMLRKSRGEAKGVATAFGSGQAEARQSALGRFKGWVGGLTK